jgi:hypothetical protein
VNNKPSATMETSNSAYAQDDKGLENEAMSLLLVSGALRLHPYLIDQSLGWKRFLPRKKILL